jgi:hypothetical protein
MLKPPLARGELRCMGATTLDEYRKYIEKDAGTPAKCLLICPLFRLVEGEEVVLWRDDVVWAPERIGCLAFDLPCVSLSSIAALARRFQPVLVRDTPHRSHSDSNPACVYLMEA